MVSSSVGSKPIGTSLAGGSEMADFGCGEEQEVHSLLIMDQHTFEGTAFLRLME